MFFCGAGGGVMLFCGGSDNGGGDVVCICYSAQFKS